MDIDNDSTRDDPEAAVGARTERSAEIGRPDQSSQSTALDTDGPADAPQGSTPRSRTPPGRAAKISESLKEARADARAKGAELSESLKEARADARAKGAELSESLKGVRADAAAKGTAVAASALAVAVVVPAPASAATAVPASAAAQGAPAPAAAPAQAPSKGKAKLAKLCGDSDAGICQAPDWPEAHLTLDSVVIGRTVAQYWPQIEVVGGWRPSDPYPDHPSGRAVDIMMPNGGGKQDRALGNEIAAYFQAHAKDYGIEYILWDQSSWTAGTGAKAWKTMSDRGSPTANHKDHIHITVEGNSNTAAQQLIDDAAAATAADGPLGLLDSASATSATPTAQNASVGMPVDPAVTRTVVVDVFDSEAGRPSGVSQKEI